jgi:hypothetical protein
MPALGTGSSHALTHFSLGRTSPSTHKMISCGHWYAEISNTRPSVLPIAMTTASSGQSSKAHTSTLQAKERLLPPPQNPKMQPCNHVTGREMCCICRLCRVVYI